jgi:hypothetical protein
VKQNNWQLNLVFNSFIFFTFIIFACLTLDSSASPQMPHFGPQSNSSASAKAYRTDSFARIYDNRNRHKQPQDLQLAVLLADLHGLPVSVYPELTAQNLDQNLANLRRAREQRENLQRTAQEQACKQAIVLKLVRDYNHRLNNLPRQVNSSSRQPVQANLTEFYQAKITEQFCNAKFDNLEQQWLYTQQLDVVCELADRKIFPKNIVGLQDFSDTVLETVALAHQANCKNLINLTKSLNNLAQDFLALGKGLVQGGYNFVGNIVNAGSNLIVHPINTTKAVTNNVANLTKNVAIGLFKILIILADSTDEHNPEGLRPYILAAQDYGHEHYQQFRNYVETVPRIQKFEQIGELISEQTLSITANFLTGKAISVISDSVIAANIAANLHQAVKVKKQADKAKPGKVTWLNKFGAPGKDVARAFGLVVAEEYELAELNGLIVSFKNGPANNNTTLFKHVDEYFQHNKSGKKVKKSRPKVAVEIAPESTVIAVTKQELLNEVNQSSVAIFKDGYYEVNGFKFTEYYYNRAWDTGRGAPSLVAKEILQSAPSITTYLKKNGFFRYETKNWEMVYNPITKEIWHI